MFRVGQNLCCPKRLLRRLVAGSSAGSVAGRFLACLLLACCWQLCWPLSSLLFPCSWLPWLRSVGSSASRLLACFYLLFVCFLNVFSMPSNCVFACLWLFNLFVAGLFFVFCLLLACFLLLSIKRTAPQKLQITIQNKSCKLQIKTAPQQLAKSPQVR